MNRWDQEMLRGQIAPEQLGYPGLMPDRQFSYGGNDISLGDIRPEENLLMRMQEAPSMRDQYQQFMKTPSPSMIGMFLEALNDPSQLPQSMQPYGAGVRDSIRGSFGGAGGMGLDIARNLFAPTTPEENSMGLAMGATGGIGKGVASGVNKVVSAAKGAADPYPQITNTMRNYIDTATRNIWDKHNPTTTPGTNMYGEPQLGGRIEANLPGSVYGDIKKGLEELYRRNFSQDTTLKSALDKHKKLTGEFVPMQTQDSALAKLEQMVGRLMNAEKGDISALYPSKTVIYDEAKSGANKNAWNAIGEGLGSIYEALGGDKTARMVRAGAGEAVKQSLEPVKDLAVKGFKALPEGARYRVADMSDDLAGAIAGPEYKAGLMKDIASEQAQYGKMPSMKKLQTEADNPYWKQKLMGKEKAPQRERYLGLEESGPAGEKLGENIYRDIAPALKYYSDKPMFGFKDTIDSIKNNPSVQQGLNYAKTAVPLAAGAGILSMLPGAEKTQAVGPDSSMAQRMIDALFGKGYDLGDIVDVPMSWKDGGGYIGRHEYNPRAASIRTDNMRDLSSNERYALEQQARKYAQDYASAANVDGQLPGRKITMLPSYINYLRDLL